MVHKGMRGGGGVGVSWTPSSIFKSIKPIDMKLGMCNKSSILLLSLFKWNSIGFHGNKKLHFQV